ncbi:MAG: Maf family protein [Asgard group archaeon]|nr:Maf family protein [Asgard group archaeon]
MKTLILASGSPRRHELLQLLGIPHKVLPCKKQEKNILADSITEKIAEPVIFKKIIRVAESKVRCVAKQLSLENPPDFILGADTIVMFNGRILGKPATEQEALQMLKKITGEKHIVYTGLCLQASNPKKLFTAVEKTTIHMRSCSEEKLKKYIQNEYVLDKAGGYAIQGKGAFLISSIEGCFYNVMGLPLSRLVRMLEEANYPFLSS